MAESIVDFQIRSMICAPLIDPRRRGPGRDPARHARPAEPLQPRGPGRAGQRGLPGGVRRGERPVARDGVEGSGVAAGIGGGPRGAAGISARRPAADSRIRLLRVLRAGQPARRRLLRLHRAARRAAGDRRGRRVGQGHLGLAADGQALGRNPLLPGQRAGPGRRRSDG